MDSEILTWLLQQAPVVVVLGGGLWAIWREYKSEKEYSRELEKGVTKALYEMSATLEQISDSYEELKDKINEIKTSVDILRSK